jgi:hypothetical protein
MSEVARTGCLWFKMPMYMNFVLWNVWEGQICRNRLQAPKLRSLTCFMIHLDSNWHYQFISKS